MILYHIFRLVRPVNLFIIVLTMYLVRRCLIIPIFTISTHINTDLKLLDLLRLHQFDFCLLVLAAVLIAAGGNIINDYFDRYIDKINKPDKVIIGNKVSEQTAFWLYGICTSLGIILSAYCAWRSGVLNLCFAYLFAATSLWFYSSNFKKSFLVGNLIVAVLSAEVTFIPALSEPEFYINRKYVLVYTLFAFLISLIREIVKDMEDREGDASAGSRTVPIVLGIRWTKFFLVILVALLSAFIALVLYLNFLDNSVIRFRLLITLFLLPFAGMIWFIVRARSKKDFHFISSYIKVIMLLGILTMFPFFYFFMH